MRRALALALCGALLALPAAADAKLKTKTFSSGDINVPLPAGGAAGFNVFKRSVKARGKIIDVNVSLRLTNANPNGDLKHLFSLRGPNNALIGLAGERAGAGYGSGAPTCAGSPTIFDDEAAIAWADPGAVAPFAGPHRPTESLTAFDGAGPRGVWDLQITSNYGNFGNPVLNCWSLVITYNAPKKKGKKKN